MSGDSAEPDRIGEGVRTISLADFVTIWNVQPSRIAWLLGAGASASAGAPLATSIRDRLLFDRYAAEQGLIRQDLSHTDPADVARVHAYFDGRNGMPRIGSNDDYSSAFELCLPNASARREFLSGAVASLRPAFGHRVLGGLTVARACDLVITTNFDDLIERGAREAERLGTDLADDNPRHLEVASLDSSLRASVAGRSHGWPLVVKLHGDFREKRLMNTGQELQEQDRNLRQFVIDSSRSFGLAVSGYSGRDESVMQMLHETAALPEPWPHGIWWMARPSSSLPDPVLAFLSYAARNGISTNVVAAPSFDETMSTLARQFTAAPSMRAYFNTLHPKPRRSPAALPSRNVKWPVLRFNALPLQEARIRLTRIALPAGWRAGDVRRALLPRPTWPVVVSGPGEVLVLGDADTALKLLKKAAHHLEPPTVATVEEFDLLADAAAAHHGTVALQALASALQTQRPLRVRTARSGRPSLTISRPFANESDIDRDRRAELRKAYNSDLTGTLPSKYGLTESGDRRSWAEAVDLSFEHQAGRSWVLFTPTTWIERPAGGARGLTDPATPWRSERWAKRRFNETWAALLTTWTKILTIEEWTEFIVAAPTLSESSGRVIIGGSSAYSRAAR